MPAYPIPFNKPYLTGDELEYIKVAHANWHLSGDGEFTGFCHSWLENNILCKKALLTHSCTAALEMSALLLSIKPGDEVIMPSYTFVSTANAFCLRGGIPVFVDVREDTLNIDETLIEEAITCKTKAVVPVHYAGVACEMDEIMAIAKQYKIEVIEDAAQGILSTYKNIPLGSIGGLGAFSFHETKNIISGEGGALLINKQNYIERAEILREKGTNRSRFFRGEVDKYTWEDIGSSFLPGELIAAFLKAQLESASQITKRRLQIWSYYHELLEEAEIFDLIRRPIIPSNCQHNGHMYYVLLNEKIDRQFILESLKKAGILAVFHYLPLHSSPAGQAFGFNKNSLQVTTRQSERLIRLPMYYDISKLQQEKVIDVLLKSIKQYLGK